MVEMRPIDRAVEAKLEGEALSNEELLSLPLFADVDRKSLEQGRFKGTFVRRRVKAGDVICREGEGGTTAFHIVDGRFRVYLAKRLNAGAGRSRRGLIARLFGLGAKTPAGPRATKPIPVDASVDVTHGQPVAILEPGDVFGELSCRDNAPRSATVVAQTDGTLIEMLRTLYEQVEKTPAFQDKSAATYRQRVLSTHLRNIPLFEGLLGEAEYEALRAGAELRTFKSGEVVFAEGDAADDAKAGGLWLVRSGQVRVAVAAAGGERVIEYLHRGEFFGEMALLAMLNGDPVPARTATCRAWSHPVSPLYRGAASKVELVRISPELFIKTVEANPRIKGRLEQLAGRRRRENLDRNVPAPVTDATRSPQVESMGLTQGQNLMLIDLARCTRCDQCVDACVAAHEDGLPRLIREGPRLDGFLVPASCRMCMDPVCMVGCPVGSIRRAEDKHIFIEDWCVGCEKCAKQCPYGSIQMHAIESADKDVSLRVIGALERYDLRKQAEGYGDQRAVVCDQCSSQPTGPACVYACPHDAALRVDAASFLAGAGAGRPPRGEGYDRETY
jgi:CRP-like cAMP-binding protein/Fe-S-cluster-containing hydrogenase component 2